MTLVPSLERQQHLQFKTNNKEKSYKKNKKVIICVPFSFLFFHIYCIFTVEHQPFKGRAKSVFLMGKKSYFPPTIIKN